MGGQDKSGIEPASTVSSPAYIDQIIAGQADGDRFVREVNQCSEPDTLALLILETLVNDSPGNPKIRGMCRAIQKALERSTRNAEEWR